MDSKISTVLVFSFIGAFLSFVIAFYIESRPQSQDFWVKFTKSCFASLIGFAVSAIFINSHYSLDVITGSKIKSNGLDVANKYVSDYGGAGDELLNKYYDVEIEHINQRLSVMPTNSVYIKPSKVAEVWSDLIGKSKISIVATNQARANIWSAFGTEVKALKVQKDAIERGVKIQRVMLITEENREELINIGCEQKKIGVDVTTLPDSDLDNVRYKEHIRKLGAADIIQVDNSYALLTDISNNGSRFDYAVLSINKETNKVTKILLDKIIEMSKPIACGD